MSFPIRILRTEGTVRVAAPDGSALEMRPVDGDPARVEIVLGDGTDAPFVREWADGFQPRCFGNRASFAGCR